MGILTDILKEVPLSAVLKEKIATAEAENAALQTENAILKDDNRKLQAENKRLRDQIQSLTHKDELNEKEVGIIKFLAQKPSYSNDNSIALSLAQASILPHPTELEFYLEKLVQQGYIKRSTITPNEYILDQIGREYAVKNNLLGIEPKLKEPETKTESPKPQMVEPTPFVPDEIDVKILVFLAKPEHSHIYAVEVGNKLDLDHALVNSHLKRLDKEGYVQVSNSSFALTLTVSITQKGKDVLNKPNYKVPHLSGSGRLPEIEEKILILISNSEIGEHPSAFPDVLDLSQVRTKHHIGNLIAQGYINANSFNDFGEAILNLSRKAIDYLVANDLDK